MSRRTAIAAALVGGCLALAACGDPGAPPETAPSSAPTPTSSTPTAAPTTPRALPTETTVPGTVPPPWLGTRVLPVTASGFGEIRPTPPELRNRRFTLPDRLPPLPGTAFASEVTSPPPADVLARSTWRPGCPVGAGDLAWVRVTFHGFDGARHTGELMVHADVAADLVQVFDQLWQARFPLEELRITRFDELDAPPTGDGNNTGGFVCRVARGTTTYSQHAYGLAVDVNPFQNPYLKGDLVLPELASAYRDRGNRRPGMITAGGPVVRAFAAIGWEWGGNWRSLKDLQHFSRNGR